MAREDLAGLPLAKKALYLAITSPNLKIQLEGFDMPDTGARPQGIYSYSFQ